MTMAAAPAKLDPNRYLGCHVMRTNWRRTGPVEGRLQPSQPAATTAGRNACNAAIAPSLANLRDAMIVERSTPACAAASRLASSPVRILKQDLVLLAGPTRTASRGAAA